MLERAEGAFNVVQFRAVGRQVPQPDTALGQLPMGLPHRLGTVNADVAQDHHARASHTVGQGLAQEVEAGLPLPGVAYRLPSQGRILVSSGGGQGVRQGGHDEACRGTDIESLGTGVGTASRKDNRTCQLGRAK